MRGRRCPIVRVGLAEARKLLAAGYKLVGRELVSPIEPEVWFRGTLIRAERGGTADGHVTQKVADRLRTEAAAAALRLP